MTTAITPCLQRTINYATQEVFAVLPSGVEPLMRDITRLRNQDMPESVIINSLHRAVMMVVHLQEAEESVKEVLGSMPE